MAITTVTTSPTIIKTVKVGTPIRRVQQTTGSISNLSDVDLTNKQNGSLLIYDPNTSKWVASVELEEQVVTGGYY